ncbi:MAG TPA: orotidine-5'-phosphate decarboxylase [Candidatus Norongarragalinales archaeon]|nr:orotidine-5'-phosphate decarboxylase [Candidatus Norongarragalinales archaeon]
MNFADQLVKEIERKDSRVCVGLDPVFEKLPKQYSGADDPAEAAFDFNRKVIDAVKDYCVIVKPSLPFHLALGEGGWVCFGKTIRYAKSKGLLTIADAKANDLGNTAAAYANAFYSDVGADAITANVFMGSDSLKPFFDYCAKDKGIFVLVKTSNPSSSEFQDLKAENGKHFYEVFAKAVANWGERFVGSEGFSSVGAVVGATFPEQAKKIRRELKNCFFLVPGYGAQGGDANGVKNCFNEEGLGAIVSASRSVLYASGGKDFAQAAGSAAKKMQDEINAVLGL